MNGFQEKLTLLQVFMSRANTQYLNDYVGKVRVEKRQIENALIASAKIDLL